MATAVGVPGASFGRAVRTPKSSAVTPLQRIGCILSARLATVPSTARFTNAAELSKDKPTDS